MKTLLLSFIIALILAGSPGTSRKPVPYDLHSAKVAHVTGVIDEDSAERFLNEIASTIMLPGPQIILINSPGGEVDAGNRMLAVIDAEKRHGVHVVCLVTREAHSMAFNLLTACDVRLAAPGSLMVVHKVATGGLSPFVRWTAANLRKLAQDMDSVDEPFRQSNAAAMHLSLKDYDKFADLETRWTAEQLLGSRYLDDIVIYEDKPSRN